MAVGTRGIEVWANRYENVQRDGIRAKKTNGSEGKSCLNVSKFHYRSWFFVTKRGCV